MSASQANPVDIRGDARPQDYGGALKVLLAAPEVDAVVALNCPTAVSDSALAADAVAAAARAEAAKPVLTAWLGEAGAAESRRRLAEAGLASYETPERAIEAFALLAGRRPPHDATVGRATPPAEAQRVVDEALAQGRQVLTDPEARLVLRAYGVPTLRSVTVRTPEEAAEAARRLAAPVAVKILSRDISHKSDVGGVRLDLQGPADVELAARDMLARIGQAAPRALIEGLVVEPMIRRPDAVEILAGIAQDPAFGPVVMVGHGGVAVQVLADRAVGLPPLDADLAREMIGRTRVSRLLAGYRHRPAADVGALAATLVALSRLAVDLPQVAELDINPLLCDAAGVLALDARIAVRRPAPA